MQPTSLCTICCCRNVFISSQFEELVVVQNILQIGGRKAARTRLFHKAMLYLFLKVNSRFLKGQHAVGFSRCLVALRGNLLCCADNTRCFETCRIFLPFTPNISLWNLLCRRLFQKTGILFTLNDIEWHFPFLCPVCTVFRKSC